MRFAATAVLAALVLSACGGGEASTEDLVARGNQLWNGEATCATCHGADLGGTSMGPPLLDEIYVPSHHPDEAIRNAVQAGVQPHHWQFGPMPPLTHLDDGDIDALIAYVRAEQRAAGIT
jgi:mono/diheme cytochrome c family protein